MNKYNFPIGTIVKRKKQPFGYHKGLVIGFNEVAHADPVKNGVICSFEEFGAGQEVLADGKVNNPQRAGVIARDLIRKGFEYSWHSANCEHFVCICNEAEPDSGQLQQGLIVAGLALAFWFFSRE